MILCTVPTTVVISFSKIPNSMPLFSNTQRPWWMNCAKHVCRIFLMIKPTIFSYFSRPNNQTIPVIFTTKQQNASTYFHDQTTNDDAIPHQTWDLYDTKKLIQIAYCAHIVLFRFYYYVPKHNGHMNRYPQCSRMFTNFWSVSINVNSVRFISFTFRN